MREGRERETERQRESEREREREREGERFYLDHRLTVDLNHLYSLYK